MNVKSAAELCEQLVVIFSDSASDFNMEQSASLLKKLSNECSHASFADEVMTHNVIPVIIDTLLQHQRIRMLDPSYCFPLFFDKLLTSASFLISNFCSCGEKYVLHYWEVNQDKLLDLLVLMSSRSCFKGIAAFLAALVTSLRPELPSHSQRLETLLASM